ncbi:MAG TPA: BrnT family toxin [Rhizomicrobium sp.]|nr:BrnT family toxin [Rhizomicrobium sp.]
MVSLDGVEGFDWDDGNVRKLVDRHGVTASEAEQIFFNDPLLLAEDAKHSEKERRMHALGKTSEERLLQVTFTFRADGKLIRVISARPMHRKERLLYEQET